MTLIIKNPIFVSTLQLVERATVIAVIEKANPEERILDTKDKMYIERYIVHTSLRGDLDSGSIIEAIAPNSSFRVFMEEEKMTSVTMFEDAFVYKETSSENITSKKEIVFFVDSNIPNVYDYAFKGLKINVRHQSVVQQIIESQPVPFRQKYTAVCCEDVLMYLQDLAQESTHIVLAKEKTPHITTQESVTPTIIPRGLSRYSSSMPTNSELLPYELHHYKVLRSIRGSYKKGDDLEVSFDGSMYNSILEKLEKEHQYAYISQKRYQLMDEHQTHHPSSEEETFFLFLRQVNITDNSQEPNRNNAPSTIDLPLEYTLGKYRVPILFSKEIQKMADPKSIWKTLWDSISDVFR